MTRKVFKILDMQCSNCPMIIESIEDVLPGILNISASYHKQQVVVDYDDALLSEKQIVSAIEKKGYTVEIT
jgi:copper chaperone CopZ